MYLLRLCLTFFFFTVFAAISQFWGFNHLMIRVLDLEKIFPWMPFLVLHSSMLGTAVTQWVYVRWRHATHRVGLRHGKRIRKRNGSLFSHNPLLTKIEQQTSNS